MLYQLETIFEHEPDKEQQKSLRQSVEDFERRERERAAELERAKLKEDNVGKAKGNSPEIIDLNVALGAIEGVVNTIHKDLIITDYRTADKIKTKYVNLTQTEKDIEREQERQHKAEEEKAEKARKEEKEKKERGISLITYYTKYINSREDDVQAGQLTGKTLGRYERVRDRLISYMKKNTAFQTYP